MRDFDAMVTPDEKKVEYLGEKLKGSTAKKME